MELACQHLAVQEQMGISNITNKLIADGTRYVNRNLAHIRRRADPYSRKVEERRNKKGLPIKRADPEILEHERKRRVELEVLELQLELEKQKLDEYEIGRRCSALRKRLLKSDSNIKTDLERIRSSDTHSRVKAKEIENKRFKSALNIH